MSDPVKPREFSQNRAFRFVRGDKIKLQDRVCLDGFCLFPYTEHSKFPRDTRNERAREEIFAHRSFRTFAAWSCPSRFLFAAAALITGSGFVSSLVRNTVSTGIDCIGKVIQRENIDLLEEAANMAIGTLSDYAFSKAGDKVDDRLRSNQPKNDSSYAGDQ
ncbi:MAG: hypothetical protein J6J21_01390 [Clostridia bacterium]|nr:hypothetical protein [Clostridia bacterium]